MTLTGKHSNVVDSQWASVIIRDVESVAWLMFVVQDVSPRMERIIAAKRPHFIQRCIYGKRPTAKRRREFIGLFLLSCGNYSSSRQQRCTMTRATKCHDHVTQINRCNATLYIFDRSGARQVFFMYDRCIHIYDVGIEMRAREIACDCVHL